ncbi:Malonyl CoA-acyl carrier protein transacylase [Actinomycetales bacterium JB111]|nr:Malonyl CoA-acyl carrier protein transacylase [Actinomycetales bacterium JB111]
MIAVLAPGQGAQTPGMLAPWLDDPATATLLAELSAAAELDLADLGTTADAETIKDTALAQPLIVAASILTYRALQARVPGLTPALTAGHSVGEFAALAVSGVLSDADAVRLVAARGRAMATASATTPTGMSAVVGGQEDEVSEAITAAGLTPANVNGGGQIVAAGTLEQLAAFAAAPPARARVIPLAVAGAFHTEHMAPAVPAVRTAADAVTANDPQIGLLSNRDGERVTSGTDAVDRVVAQVANPVRWDLCCETILASGVTGAVELAPAGVLSKLAKRTLRGVTAVAVSSPEDLDAAAELITSTEGAS